jgi:hypothetical protein
LEPDVSRLTRNIKLVLISSSLAVAGCQQESEEEWTCARPEPITAERAEMPPACGPVDGHGGVGVGHSSYHSPSNSFWLWRTNTPHTSISPTGVGNVGSFHSSGGHASVGGSARGGFGASAHGASS